MGMGTGTLKGIKNSTRKLSTCIYLSDGLFLIQCPFSIFRPGAPVVPLPAYPCPSLYIALFISKTTGKKKIQLLRIKTIKPTRPMGREALGRALFKTVQGKAKFDCNPALQSGKLNEIVHYRKIFFNVIYYYYYYYNGTYG